MAVAPTLSSAPLNLRFARAAGENYQYTLKAGRTPIFLSSRFATWFDEDLGEVHTIEVTMYAVRVARVAPSLRPVTRTCLSAAPELTDEDIELHVRAAIAEHTGTADLRYSHSPSD